MLTSALANSLEAVEQGFTHVEGSINAYGWWRARQPLFDYLGARAQAGAHHDRPRETRGDELGARILTEAETATLERRVEGHHVEAARPGKPLLQLIDPPLLHGFTERRRRALLDQVEAMEAADYDLRNAGGRWNCWRGRRCGRKSGHFSRNATNWRATRRCPAGGLTTATVTIWTGDHIRTETEDGDGAVNALERSLRQCRFALYPEIAAVHMTDYQVKPLEPAQGAMSRARVACTWSEGTRQWVTAGVARDIVEDTWLALVDAFRLSLVLLGDRKNSE